MGQWHNSVDRLQCKYAASGVTGVLAAYDSRRLIAVLRLALMRSLKMQF
jgi:hypothetical protein